jgi:hypothetical protein
MLYVLYYSIYFILILSHVTRVIRRYKEFVFLITPPPSIIRIDCNLLVEESCLFPTFNFQPPMITVESAIISVEVRGRVVVAFGPGLKDPGHTQSHYFHICSPVQHDWFIKGWMVCGLPVIHAPKRPLGNLPGSGLLILAKVWITGPQWHPTTVIRITLNERMQKKP